MKAIEVLGSTLLSAFLTSTAVLAETGYGAAFDEPQPRNEGFCRAQLAAGPMPRLAELFLRTDPEVHVDGRAIKGMYYAEAAEGPNDVIAFRMTCDRALERRPFLVFDFRTSQYSLDENRDGCVEESGRLSEPEIDPVEFMHDLNDIERYCYDDGLST